MLTPQEIEQKIFKVSFKGYNVNEVDDFLQEICDSYLEIYQDNRKTREQMKRLSEAVEQYKAMEGTLKDSLSVAGKSSEAIESEARHNAEKIIRSAEREAKAIVAGAEQKIAEEAYRLESIKRETEIYKSKIVELLNAQLSVIKGYPRSGSFEIDTKTEGGSVPRVWNTAEFEDTAELPGIQD